MLQYLFFVNKTQRKAHRVAVHPRQRENNIDDDELDFERLVTFDLVEDGAVEILGKRNGLYLMSYGDSTQWLKLSDEHVMVQEFKHKQEEERKEAEDDDDCLREDNMRELPLISSEHLKDWLTSKIVDEDDFTVSEMDLV